MKKTRINPIKSKTLIINISLLECVKTAVDWLNKEGHRRVEVEKDNNNATVKIIEYYEKD